jgi:hypothetical protein
MALTDAPEGPEDKKSSFAKCFFADVVLYQLELL